MRGTAAEDPECRYCSIAIAGHWNLCALQHQVHDGVTMSVMLLACPLPFYVFLLHQNVCQAAPTSDIFEMPVR
jgi:hypothetical protein